MTGLRITTSRPTAKVQLDFPGSQNWGLRCGLHTAPVFLAGQTVFGTVTVKYEDIHRIHPQDYILVQFRGLVESRSWSPNHPCGELWDHRSKKEKILDMAKSYKIMPEASEQGEALVPALEYVFGFSFQACESSPFSIRHGLPEPADHHSLFDTATPKYIGYRSMPSTVQMRTSYPRIPGGAPHRGAFELVVRYSIQASLRRSENGYDTTIVQALSEVTILDDSLGIQPPTCTTDFQSEYQLVQSVEARLKRSPYLQERLNRRSLPKMVVRAGCMEPPPLIFHKNDSYATTAANVTLTIPYPAQTIIENRILLPEGDIEFSWKLQKSVYSSLEGLKTMPTLVHLQKPNTPGQVLRQMSVSASHAYRYYLDRHKWNLIEKGDTPETASPSSSDGIPEMRTTEIEQVMDIDEGGPSDRSSHGSNATYVLGQTRSLPAHETATYDASGRTTVIEQKQATVSAQIPIPVHVSAEYLPTPTSFTSFVAVRYSLEIQMTGQLSRIENDSDLFNNKVNTSAKYRLSFSRRHTTTVSNRSYRFEAHLNVPVQIVYDSLYTRSDPDRLPDFHIDQD